MLCDDGSDTDDSFSADEEGESAPRPSSTSVGLDSTSFIPLSSDSSAGNMTSSAASAEGAGQILNQGEAVQKEEEEKKKEGKVDSKENEESEGPEDKGDPEMTPVYLKRLLPIFTEIYHSSLAPTLRKESLRLMRKMCRYISAKCLQDLCEETLPADPTHPPFSAQISEVLAAVLENEDDHEPHLSALHIMQDLLAKNRAAFDEQFIRLGLPNKIAALAGPLDGGETPEEGDEAVVEKEGGKEEVDDSSASAVEVKEVKDGKLDVKESSNSDSKESMKLADSKELISDSKEMAKQQEEKVSLEDAVELVVAIPYQWRDWCVVRSRDCLYLWNDYCVIELSNVSNGWFRFLVDNRLATMYSSGSTEGGPDSYGQL